MKILHFSWEYPPVMFGGLGAHVVELTREQVKQGHQVTVITQQSDPASPVSEVVQGVQVLRANNAYPNIPFAQESLDMWAHGFALGSFAAARDHMGDWIPEIVHGHDWVGAEQTQLLSRHLNIPQVITIHATEFGRHQGWLVTRTSRTVHARELRAIAQASRVIVCSEYMKHELVDSLGSDYRKISVVPNGVDSSESGSFRLPRQSHDPFTIGFLGRVEWEKGAHHVIDALALLNNSRFRVRIVGIGSQLPNLISKVARLGLTDQVDLFGYVSSERKRELLSECNVLVVPSSYEPFGIVALEAGLAGVPLVVSRAGGLRDVIPNQEFGYPLEVVTGETIAQCVKEIDINPQESNMRAQKFFNRVVNVYNWASIANLTTDVYRVAMEVEGMEVEGHE